MASFDSVNYAIRPNKAVERKLIFAALLKIARKLDFSLYRYIGFGSLWFVDFVMAHKLLGISSMESIEKNEIGFRRGSYNCPLKCINMIRGESSLVIPELNLDAKPSVIWFDYDSGIGSVALNDIQAIISKCAADTIVLVTLSAKIDDLPDKDEAGNELSPETSLRQIAGDLVPTPLSNKTLQRKNYPRLVSQILNNQFITSAINSGRPEKFIKLFDLVYTDGTPMVTIGGVMASSENVEYFNSLIESGGWDSIAKDTINIPPLTIKEKMALDQFLPSLEPLTSADVDKIGFPLKMDQIAAYQKYYIHYPTFGEFQI